MKNPAARIDAMGYLAHVSVEGRMLARAARLALRLNVPTCRDWSVDDLVAHVGMIHRRAAVMVRERWMAEAFLNTTPACPAAGLNRVDGIPFSLAMDICNRELTV